MQFDPISRVRRFHRAVTSEVGLLDSSFLGLGRPLGPARVINAIGNGMSEIGEIRAYLRLDSGLMSRLLRGLESEGLVATRPGGRDGRRRRVVLTDAGRRAFEAYEALSATQAADILERHAARDALLDAMDLIASTLGRDRITLCEVAPEDPRARACLRAYYDELAETFPRGFDVSLSRDPDARDLERPRGAFLLALSDGLPIGCGGLKGTDKGYAEIKRLWVSKSARGLGLARRIMAELERLAGVLGVDLLRLDTNGALAQAVALYRATGWTEIGRFNDDPYPDLFFEKRLG